ncbi:MAG: WD40/YVTN/BNR-like repeat-containing protein [Chitinophagaceae bacterium]
MKPIILTIIFSAILLFSFSQTNTINWQKQNTVAYPGKQDDICFVDENNGWYCNGQGKIYRTNNAGTTWEKVYEKPGTFFRCIAFIDTLKGFVGNVGTDYFPNVKDTIPLYQTEDGGKTWLPVNYTGNYVKGLCALDIVKEQFINHGNIDYKYHIYGVGRVGTPANIMVSHDAGKTFTSVSMNNDCKMLFDIKMFNTKEGFVCAANNEDISQSNALILYTKDGGKTWEKQYQSTRPFETTWKISFPSRKVGYVTIQSYNPDTTVNQQHIAKTIDGGITWTEINLCEDGKAREFGVGFIDENNGFVGTTNSGYETNNGGLTWTKTNIGRAANKIRVYNFSKSVVSLYAIGVNVYKGIVNK